MAALWQGKKDCISDDVSWGEFLQLVITGEYNVLYCWPFSGTDAMNATNVSAHSRVTPANSCSEVKKRIY